MQLKLLSRVVESYHGPKPVSKSGSTIRYGPYNDIAPFTGGTLSAHFENNSPFLDALSLTREIEVSHWGNVYVEEWYTVKHTGAHHKVSTAPRASISSRTASPSGSVTANMAGQNGCII